MPVITKILEPRDNPRRRVVYLDGAPALKCTANLVAKLALQVGMSLTDDQVREARQGTVRQSCFDQALRYLQRTPHSRKQLAIKLARREYTPAMIDAALDDLVRLGYVNDEQFAAGRAAAAAQQRHHGPRRALAELAKAGVAPAVAQQAVHSVFTQTDSLAVARALAEKQAPRLRKLDPLAARRRLAGMLARRGFEYETIRPVIDDVLGTGRSDR